MANPRPPQGNRGQSAGLAHPSTPRKNGAELSALVHSFGQQWQLGLPIRDKNWSPLKSTNELQDKVYEQLKRLYWQGDFHEAIGRFVLQAKPPSLSDTQSARTARLTLLHEIVREIDEAKGRDSGSLEDQDLLNVEDPVEAQLRRELARMEELNHGLQDPPPRSSSTYGSVDEDVILERSFTVETEDDYDMPAGPMPQSLTRLPRPSGQGANPVSPVRRARYLQSPTTERSPFNNPPRRTISGERVAQSARTTSGASPAKAPSHSTSKPANDSPSKLPHYIRNIPEQNLFTPILAEDLGEFPYFVLFVCSGLASEYNVPLATLLHGVHASCALSDPSDFLEQVCASLDISIGALKDQQKYWSAFKRGFEGYTFKARIEYNNPDSRRTWKVFHVEPCKKKKKNGRITDDLSDKRIVLFATDGIGIDTPTSIGEAINWFFPFEKNMHQAYTKANARLDLGLSRTIPTIAFKPSQIVYVKDMTVDETPEDTHFNDNTLESWPHIYPKDTVMNDGCSLISVGAALLIWQKVRKILNSDEPMPSAFQARIGGAKGVWMISGEPYSASADDHDIWIQISESQLKFKPHREDRSDGLEYDPLRLTFEYVNHSRRPVPSELHISFIPILVDRGVPRNHIADLMVEQLDAERDELIQLLPTTERLYHWVHQEGPSNSGFESPRWQGEMYQSLPEQIKHLFESGFVPEQEPYLADCLYRFIKRRQLWMESKLRVSLYQSTFVLGIADPFGILEPGELHMEFSTPFIDELTGSRLRSLDNMEILVSRQPACRRSDIQKVRAVKCPELSHLIDVVVFPTKGQYPLAGKLQGGDYDGDIFWLCWDQAMVKPFKNAPAPMESPDPAQYGIEQDTRKLSEVMDLNDLSTVNDFLKEALECRLTPSLLGIVTSHLEKQAYYENQVFSGRLDALCDMHDLLVDAPKQGYKFTLMNFKHYVGNVLRCGNPKEPAYKEAMKDCEKKETDEGHRKRKESYKHEKENIIDYLYFEIVRKHDVATLEQVKNFFSRDYSPDTVLQYPYLNLREAGSPEVQQELDALVKGLKQVERKWLDITMADENVRKPDWYSQAVDTCYARYRSILPTQVDHFDIKPLVYPFLQPQYSEWEKIRASTFYVVFTKRHKLVWAVAGKQLAELKAASYAGSTAVVPKIKAIMKPKAPKAPRLEEYESEDEFEDALEELNAEEVV
ncbi:hypothetical protein SLS60_010112 [Paraconiothyrium brasiliense]|uniref:RNA-dependent RNA polymerase n=1 Tax=Paraconiothyrium brasiliense TaxID=300254 RepID=A0ABR3QQB4_9PLEO